MIPSRTILPVMLFALPPLAYADINWSYEGASTDISSWSALTMGNSNSSVIGSFGDPDSYGSRVAKLVNDYESESSFSEYYYSNGLISSRADGAYLSYSLNAGDLTGYGGGQIKVGIYSAGPVGLSYTPPAEYIFLEGNLNGERLLMACAYPVSANGAMQTSTFNLDASVFRPVTEFYCTVEPVRIGPFNYNQYTPNISLSDGLSEAEFDAFLETVTAVTFWAAHDTSISALGQVPSVYTYVQSLSITEPIPEPGTVTLGFFGTMTLLLNRRKRI